MKQALKIALGLGAVLVLGLAVVAVAARFSDGPTAIFAGGPFTTGETKTGAEPDWRFLRDRQEVEFQLLEPARSRTTWILEHDGRIFIPSGYMNTTWGKLWKQWPIEALADPRAILRVDDTLYPRRLVRIEGDTPIVEPLLQELGRKYLGGAAIEMEHFTSGNLWLFELVPRG